MKQFRTVLLLVWLLGINSALASTYYVATNGLDTAAGTLAAPFQTISKAASVMVAGDTCYVRGGTYRESVTPANSGTAGNPITYQAYANEAVTISGAEIVSNWSLDSGITHKAALATNFFASPYNHSDQIFVDGTMVTLAKWPNTTTALNAYPSGTAPAVDVSHPAKSVITSAAGFYTGAQIFFQPNNGAWSWTFSGKVTSVSGSQITFTTYNGNGEDGNNAVYAVGSRYYLFNKKEFLDAPGEWWHDMANGQLFIIMPNSGSPTGHLIEAKKRDFAFDLSNKSYITVSGFSVFACTITTDSAAGGSNQGYDASGNTIYPWRGAGSVASANHIILDRLNAKYLSHFTDVSGHFYLQWGQSSGIVLSGSDCVLQNSILQYSGGNGVSVLGQRNKVLNNFIYDTACDGTDTAFINTGGATTSVDHEIATNTCVRTGRSGINPRGLQNSNAGGGQFVARIHHNDVSQFMIQDWDGGAIYGAGDGKFTRIDHNLFHDSSGFTCSGAYVDWSKNYIIDHNVIWNVEWGIHLQAQDGGSSMANHLVYNNTVGVKNTSGAPYGPFGIVNNQNPGNNTGTVIENNIVWLITPPAAAGYQAIPTSGFGGATIAANLLWDGVNGSATDPKFVGASTNNYQIQTTSAARNTGLVISTYVRDGVSVPAYNDSVDGQPDKGAYENGITAWTAGAVSAKTATTTSLTSSLNPSTGGNSVTFTATVSPSAASGTVTFKDGAATLGTGTLSGGVATYATSALSAGSHSITAVYGGDVTYASSTSSVLTQTVNGISTATALTSSLNPSISGNSVTFTATVSPSAASGTVTFKDGAATLGTGTLSGGVAAYATSALSVGSHSITAVYGGNANYSISTSSLLTQTVNINNTVPSVPTGLTATAGDTQVTLSWSASSGATSYNVKRATTSGGPYSTITSPTATSYTDAGLANGVTYYYVVSAVNGVGESANSTPANATPANSLPSP